MKPATPPSSPNDSARKIRFREFAFTGYTVTDMERARTFYEKCSDGPALALEVEDFDATVAALREQGVRFTAEPLDVPTCLLAVILDPDGNSLAIHRRKPPVQVLREHADQRLTANVVAG